VRLETLNSRRPDILLVDLQLPGLSGWDLIKQIRALFSAAPIVAFSACVYPEDKRRAEEAGCSVFLTKPLPPTEVLNALVALLRHEDESPTRSGMPDA
jgi:DNA-binding response OmpR family regulator